MANSYVDYIGDSITTDFTVTFDYLNPAHVFLRVGGVSTSFTWVNTSTIRIAPAPASQASVRIYRETPHDTRIVDFQDATVLNETDLDLADLQLFYLMQEALDYTDVMYLAEVVDACKLYKTQAETAKTNAETAEALAEKWATEAEDVVVQDGKYSSYHWAQKAEDAKDQLNAGIFNETTAPSTSANQVKVYAKDVSGVTELFIRKESNGSELQITSGGSLKGGVCKPEDFGAVGDGTADDTTAMQSFFNNSFKKGELSVGKTYKVSSLTIPVGTEFYGDASAVIKKSNTSGVLLQLAGSDITLRGFTVDGSHTDNSYANGFISGHYGIKSAYSAGNPTSNIRLEGLTVKNCGETGIDLRLVDDSRVERCTVTRCGYAGIAVWSGLRVNVRKNRVDDIYGGNGGTPPALNAYGIVMSNYSADRTPETCWIKDNFVTNVPSWTGIDEHNGKNIFIIGNRVEMCAQGIACEHHVEGASLRNIQIINNSIHGWSDSQNIPFYERDGQTYYLTGGIIVNGGVNAEQGQTVVINNNNLRFIGDTRTSAGSCGAIKVEQVRGLTVVGNSLYGSYCNGILFYDNGANSVLYAQVSGNVIDGVYEVHSIRRGFYASSRVMGNVTGNFANYAGTPFSQVGSPTYITTFADNKTN